jgi:hypothetical protein
MMNQDGNSAQDTYALITGANRYLSTLLHLLEILQNKEKIGVEGCQESGTDEV